MRKPGPRICGPGFLIDAGYWRVYTERCNLGRAKS